MTPSGSRSATLLLPGCKVLANASLTSSVMGIGQSTPLASFMF